MDSLPKQFGMTGLTWQGTSREFSADRGWHSVVHWKGDHAAVETNAELLAAGGYSLSTEHIGGTPKSLLHVTIGGSTFGAGTPDPDVPAPPVIWSLQASAEEMDLSQHPEIRTRLYGISEEDLASLTKWINMILAGETPTFSPPTGPDEMLVKYAESKVRGVNSFYTTRWILRKTQTVAPNTDLSDNQTNTLCVFTTAELVADEAIPATIIFQLPVGEWLKLAGTTEQLQDGRFQFTQEWYFGYEGDWDDSFIPIYPHADFTATGAQFGHART